MEKNTEIEYRLNQCKQRFREGMVVKDFFGDISIVVSPDKWKYYSNSSIYYEDKKRIPSISIYLYTADNDRYATIIYKEFDIFF